jgi:hypothetical protein
MIENIQSYFTRLYVFNHLLYTFLVQSILLLIPTIVCMQLTFWIGIPLNFRIMLITLFTYHYGILPLFTQNISFKSSNSDGSNTTDRLNCFLVQSILLKKNVLKTTPPYIVPLSLHKWLKTYSLISQDCMFSIIYSIHF